MVIPFYFQKMMQDLHFAVTDNFMASQSNARLPSLDMPSILFLFVITSFCLQLPPDIASQQRPCFQLQFAVINACLGLTPYSKRACMAHTKQGGIAATLLCVLFTGRVF